MLSAEKLLSATDIQRVLGLSRESLRKMRARGEAPKSVRVGSVNVTPLIAASRPFEKFEPIFLKERTND
jgi:hypothetical protein